MTNEETSSRVADRMSRRFDREAREDDSEPTTDSGEDQKTEETLNNRVGSKSKDSTEDQKEEKSTSTPNIGEDEDKQQRDEFIDTLLVERRTIEENRNRKVVSVTDPLWSSLLTALEDHPDQKRELLDSLKIDDTDPSRSEISRKVLYAGLRSVAPDLYEDLTQAEAKRAVEDL